MKLAAFLLVLFPAVIVCSACGADEVGEMLKVTPVEDRPIEDKKDPENKKTTVIPAQPPPTPAPQSGATPEEQKTAEAAGETGSESIVPEAFPLSRYASLWETSPFQTKSVAPPPQSEELSNRFVLGGILRENGEPVIWVRERATQQSFKVGRSGPNGPGPNSRGVSLVEVQEVMTNQSAATAIIRVGDEQGVIKFDAPSGAMPGMAAVPQIPAAQNPGVFPGRNPAVPVSGAPTSAGGVVPGQIPANVAGRTAAGVPSIQPGGTATAVGQPGVVPSVPGPGVPQTQAPSDQQQMPPPRVIRRRAIVPAAPSTP